MICTRITRCRHLLHCCLNKYLTLAGAAVLALASLNAAAQSLSAVQVVPPDPTSADSITLKITRACGDTCYMTPTYSVSNLGTEIRVVINTQNALPPACEPATAFAAPLLVDLGQLPAGNYSLSVLDRRIVTFEFVELPVATNITFTVSDRRTQSPIPVTRLNYSDHWWDATDMGAGFMIWHSASDQMLVVWFAYGPDGKATWYTVQGGAWLNPTRYQGPMVQTSRAPDTSGGGGFPALSTTQGTVIGDATLDFGLGDGANSARLTYRLTGASADVVRNLRRFGK